MNVVLLLVSSKDYFDEPVFLRECKDLLLVCFQDASSRKQFISEIHTVSSIKIWNSSVDINPIQDDPYNQLILQSLGPELVEDLKRELNERVDVRYVSPVFSEDNVHFSSVSDEFSVKLRSRSDYSELASLSREYGCEIVRYEGFDEGVFFVRLPKESDFEVMELSAAYYETGLFEFASPGFFWFGAMSSVDPLYTYQWGLKNTGQLGAVGLDINAEAAWNITEGSSDIVVAVLDNGVELSHPDLSANLVTGYDALDTLHTYGGAPLENNAGHGTAVAGIIGAVRGNGAGISGIAPESKMMPIRIGYYSISDNKEKIYCPAAVKGITWARTHGADVLNCSWGGGSPDALLTSAIHNATTLGRGGKGCVVIFSSGNENNSSVSYPGSLYDVMAVGAISCNGKRKSPSTPDGELWWGSNYGSTLDVVAPGVFIYTTDRLGNDGYNPDEDDPTLDIPDRNYTARFGGTSAAAPYVAGIAALILSEYPDLPQDLVRRAIELSCNKLSSYNFVEDDNYPSATWHNEVGYGLVDAFHALGEAGNAEMQNTLDNTAGLDFTIINSSSYPLDDVIVDVRGTIDGQTEWLISCDIMESVRSGRTAGYPVNRGETLTAVAGTPITNITLDLFASCVDCPGNLEVGVAYDTPTPNSYTHFNFGYGNTCQFSLPNMTVPNGERRRVYIRVFDGE